MTASRGRLAPAAAVLGVVAVLVVTGLTVFRSPELTAASSCAPPSPTITAPTQVATSVAPTSLVPPVSSVSETSAPVPTASSAVPADSSVPTSSPVAPTSSSVPTSSPAVPTDSSAQTSSSVVTSYPVAPTSSTPVSCPPPSSPPRTRPAPVGSSSSSPTSPRLHASPPPHDPCDGLALHFPSNSDQSADLTAATAAVLDSLRQYGFSARVAEDTSGHVHDPSSLFFDISDGNGPGGVLVDIARYAERDKAGPATTRLAYDCISRWGDHPRWLQDGTFVTIFQAESQVLYGTTGRRVMVNGYEHVFTTDQGGDLPPTTRTVRSLSDEQLLAIARRIEALG